jgi:hypothetical protein
MYSASPADAGTTVFVAGRGRRAKFGDEFLEVVGGLEVLVDAGEADIGDGVDPGQGLHHDSADLVGWDVGFTETFKSSHNTGDHLVDPLALDRALLKCNANGTFKFVAIEGLAFPVLLDDDQISQLDTLVSRETTSAGGAESSAADGDVVLGGAAVLDLGVDVSAEGTAHESPARCCSVRRRCTIGGHRHLG